MSSGPSPVDAAGSVALAQVIVALIQYNADTVQVGWSSQTGIAAAIMFAKLAGRRQAGWATLVFLSVVYTHVALCRPPTSAQESKWSACHVVKMCAVATAQNFTSIGRSLSCDDGTERYGSRKGMRLTMLDEMTDDGEWSVVDSLSRESEGGGRVGNTR